MTEPKRSQRADQKEKTRQRLIEATIDVVASEGLSGTTMGKVARKAGLSQGIVNFHFESKEKLLGVVLAEITEAYHSSWQEALENVGDDPGERLTAFVRALFHPRITARHNLRCWFAFWGDAYARRLYREIGSRVDELTAAKLIALCQELLEATGSDKTGEELTAAAFEISNRLVAMVTGFWLMKVLRDEFQLESAVASCLDYLREVYPDAIQT